MILYRIESKSLTICVNGYLAVTEVDFAIDVFFFSLLFVSVILYISNPMRLIDVLIT